MLFAGFLLFLFAMTSVFNGILDRQENPNADPDSRQLAGGGAEVVLQRNRQGHYVSGGQINDLDVTFLLDTGATVVAIPSDIARAAGLRAEFRGQAETANGTIEVYYTHIDRLELGDIVLYDVEASITQSMGGDTILLGMSALGEVEFTQRGSTLTLRQVGAYN